MRPILIIEVYTHRKHPSSTTQQAPNKHVFPMVVVTLDKAVALQDGQDDQNDGHNRLQHVSPPGDRGVEVPHAKRGSVEGERCLGWRERYSRLSDHVRVFVWATPVKCFAGVDGVWAKRFKLNLRRDSYICRGLLKCELCWTETCMYSVQFVFTFTTPWVRYHFLKFKHNWSKSNSRPNNLLVSHLRNEDGTSRNWCRIATNLWVRYLWYTIQTVVQKKKEKKKKTNLRLLLLFAQAAHKTSKTLTPWAVTWLIWCGADLDFIIFRRGSPF